jgi:hypothetical protein
MTDIIQLLARQYMKTPVSQQRQGAVIQSDPEFDQLDRLLNPMRENIAKSPFNKINRQRSKERQKSPSPTKK